MQAYGECRQPAIRHVGHDRLRVADRDVAGVCSEPGLVVFSQGVGCLNPDATLTSPQDGESISGTVKILGTANIQNFAFYKVEYRSLTPDSSWLTVSAGTVPVCEGKCEISEELGSWDTSLVSPGEYGFRLVVTDTEGNAPLPCEIQVRVLPTQLTRCFLR